jgi:hypothetical protein
MAAPGPWVVVDAAKKYLGDGTIDFDTDTLKVALFTSTTTPTASSITTYSTTNEVGTTNTGYTAGGNTVTTPAVTQSGTTTKYTASAIPAWTAGSAGLTARWAMLYKSGTANSVTNPAIAYMLLDSTPADVTTSSPNTLTINMPANGFFTITGN